jgi:hypothetical protein
MFYREEDIQPVVDVITATLGQQGIMMDGKRITKNIILGSTQFGKLWYGDVDGDMEYIHSICGIVSQRTGHTVSVVSDTF